MNPGTRRILALLAALAAVVTSHQAVAADSGPRDRLLLDTGWRFHLGNDWGPGYSLSKAGAGYGAGSVAYSDASWRRVDLPHDWAIELPFDPSSDAAHGFKPIGEAFPQNSVAWYRRSFELPASDAGRRIWIEFDGAYRDCTVIVNGWFVGHHESGYSGFRYDITDVANCGGSNVVSVRVDASKPEGWFYEGAGIYRHVWLVKTSPLALAPDGVYAISNFKDNVPKGSGPMRVLARVVNAQTAPVDATVIWTINGPDGGLVTTVTQAAHLGPMETQDVEQQALVKSPMLWSPETPNLYTLVTSVTAAGKTTDKVETDFGIRTVGFDPEKGFMLNGAPYALKGTSNHQDHAGVGSALPDALQYFRIARLKEMGCNAYRTAHNPPTPELLEACDRLGMIVMDENRQLGSDRRHLELLEELVRRDRNHPSVGIWSLGNEEFTVQGTPSGKRVAAAMQELVKRLDPTRPVTCNAAVGNEYPGVNEAVEVRGWSYHVGKDMDDYHKEHPQQPNVGSEQGSTVSTRGIYANDPVRGYVSAYDDNAPEWAQTAETWVSFFGPRPWLSGGFVWTGFDYRGEPTPYGWPCINSHFGIMDTCGFPKDNFYYYQSVWSDRPMVHILPHWNWPGREGQEIDVRTQTNCDEVELFLNGKSLGRQPAKKYSEIKWKVAYAPGKLSASAYKDGKVAVETEVETAGPAQAVRLSPNRTEIDADGEDVAVFTVSVVDAHGLVVPTAGNKVSFALEGPGRIIGVGNGDPSCHEPDTVVTEAPTRSLPVDGWRWKKVADPYPENLPEESVGFDDSKWEKYDVRADSGGTLGYHDRGVFRTRFDVSAADLASSAVELVFGRLAGGITVYINGRKVGGTVDDRNAVAYDVKELLHSGENVIAVPMANYGPEPMGPCKGVTLRMQGMPPAPQWGRSVFNGLAEVIVKASREAGTIALTASAEGLAPGTFSLKTQEADARPSVP